MEPLTTSGQMQKIDRRVIEKLRIPGVVLMENAGRGIASTIEKCGGPLSKKHVLVVCGKGNNGGDGFVAARHLLNCGARISVAIVGKARDVRGDAKVNLDILKKVAGGERRLAIFECSSSKSLSRSMTPDVVVDALFGTGFSGKVREPYKGVIRWINNSRATVVAVDVPSGVNADTGAVADVAVHADLTVTMGMMKIGLAVGKGRECAGKVRVERLGVPRTAYGDGPHRSFLAGARDVRILLPKRPRDAHKHSVGKIFVIAGSRGLTGAAAMVSEAAMRMGAGAVVLGTPKSVYPILAKKLTEVMVESFDETAEGSLSMNALPSIERYVKWSDVVVLGPGLSRNPETRELIRVLVRYIDKPLLLDADGLNAFERNSLLLKKKKSAHVIITPHTGELSRMSGMLSREIESDRVGCARALARTWGVTVVLKGPSTVTAGRDGTVIVNSTGNPGMATAGSGDVLAGIIAALRSQRLPDIEAAYCGVYIHGLAGDIAEHAYGERGLLATDILAKSVDAVKHLENS